MTRSRGSVRRSLTTSPRTSASMIPATGLEGHLLPGDPHEKGKTGGAAAAVPAHLHLGAVGVEEPPPEIDPVGRLDEDQTVRPHGDLPLADALHEVDDIPHGERPVPVVDQDEVVAASAHLDKIQSSFHLTWHMRPGGPRNRRHTNIFSLGVTPFSKKCRPSLIPGSRPPAGSADRPRHGHRAPRSPPAGRRRG